MPLSQTGSELLFDVFSRRYENGATIVTSNLPFQEWTTVFASERLTGALLDRITHHVHILEMNGESYRLKQSPVTTPANRPNNPPLDPVGPQAPPTRGPPPAAPRARRPARGVPPMDYADKLPPSPWYIFAPPRRYIFPPPLTRRPKRPIRRLGIRRCREFEKLLFRVPANGVSWRN